MPQSGVTPTHAGVSRSFWNALSSWLPTAAGMALHLLWWSVQIGRIGRPKLATATAGSITCLLFGCG